MKSVWSTALLLIVTCVSEARDFGYRYRDGHCVNESGEPGLNPGFFGQCSDLRHVTMIGLNFDDEDFSGSSFEGSELKNVTFRRANLTAVDFTSTTFETGAFDNAVFAKANFTNANLKDVFFTNANLSSVSFKAANLNSVTFKFATILNGDFSGARLIRTNMESAKLSDIDFSDVYLTQTKFSSADLVLVRFRAAHLRGSIFEKAILTDGDFSGADLRGTRFQGALVNGVKWTGAIYDQSTVLPFNSKRAEELGLIAKSYRVFLFWDYDGPEIDGLIANLKQNGVEVTKSPRSTNTYDGTPGLSGYTAVVHLAGASNAYDRDIDVKGQRAIVEFVKGGGTYVGTQFISYMFQGNSYLQEMEDLVLLKYVSANKNKMTYVPRSEKEAHPVLDGFEGPFEIKSVFSVGGLREFAEAKSEVLATMNGQVPAIAVRELGKGKVVNFTFSASIADPTTEPDVLRQEAVRRLILNSVTW